VFSPGSAPDDSRWTAVDVPWKPGTAHVNLLGTIQTQAIDPTPVSSTLTAKLVTKTRRVKHKTHTDIFYSYSARITGQLRRGSGAAAGANVDLFAGTKKIATTTTNQNGSFSATFKLTRTTTYHASFSMQTAVVGGSCNPALRFGNTVMPCGSITSAGFTAQSENRTVKKPKLKVKHVKTKKPKKRPKHR
jgi:hypothetical protein